MKKLSLTIFLIVSIICISTVVNAAYSFGVKMVSDKSDLIAGNEVTIGISVSDIDVGNNGISAFKATLNYDTNIFENITKSSFTAENNWSVQGYNEDNKMITLTNSGFVKNDQEIVTLKLKVKAGATLGKTVISLKDIVVSNNETDIQTNAVSYNLNITTASTNVPSTNIPNITTNSVINNVTTSNSTTKNNTTTISKVNSTTNNSIPHAGIEDFSMPVAFIAIILAGVGYINYRKYKEI